MEYKFVVNSPEETYRIGERIGENLSKGQIVTLSGDLGAGKTVITKGILNSLGYKGEVTSPTYTIMNVYELPDYSVYHYDAYRLASFEDLYDVGFWDYRDEGISIVEWAPNVFENTPKNTVKIEIKRKDEESLTKREIYVVTPDEMEDINFENIIH